MGGLSLKNYKWVNYTDFKASVHELTRYCELSIKIYKNREHSPQIKQFHLIHAIHRKKVNAVKSRCQVDYSLGQT